MSDRALQFAMTLSPDVIAVHLTRLAGPDAQTHTAELKARWAAEVEAPLAARGIAPPKLMCIPAPYRNIQEPLLELIEKLDADTPGRSVAVLIPELVLKHWWERLLHLRRSERLRRALLEFGGERVNVVISPWRG